MQRSLGYLAIALAIVPAAVAAEPLVCTADATCGPRHQVAARPVPKKPPAGEREARPGGLPDMAGAGILTVLRLGGTEPDRELQLPLEHTDVRLNVSGFVARAEVTQYYANPYDLPIEAVYTFPLPADAAVDAMTMRIGERTIRGDIRRRDEARQLYEQAKAQGQPAALLDQERPNIFTQAVANIMPKDRIEITIGYVDLLTYSDGGYELVFPMVVGPRYLPGEPIGHCGAGAAPDTGRVPDASKISPEVLPPATRSGHDIALSVELEAGVPIRGLYSSSHALDVWDLSPTRRWVELSPADTVPNRDFVLRFQTAGPAVQSTLLAHRDDRGGFFTLLVQPQREITDVETVPRELIFIIDTSGSMSGLPLAKSMEAMQRLIAGMRPTDRFNIVRFAGDTGTLWEAPQPYSRQRAAEALAFIGGLTGGGGTEMAKGITAALSQPARAGYLRLALLLTDGYVDEREVFASVNAERRGARIFTLGVGSSVNRYLLDRAAILGRGETFYLRHDEESAEVIDRFFRRIDRPALANIEIDWQGIAVGELYPKRIPDLFAGQPLRIHGRYDRGGHAEIVIRGQLGAKPYRQRLEVELPAEPGHEAMASIWARQKIKTLMLDRVEEPSDGDQRIEEITRTGLEFRLLTQWTSFVAVEETVVNEGGKSVTVAQPVELPEGVSYEGVFGGGGGQIGAIGGSAGGFALLGTLNGGVSGATAGILGVGTSGPAAGGAGFGYGISRGSTQSAAKQSRRSSVRMATPTVMGTLPREVIAQVIKENENQVRYCYEIELQRDPSLQGKIVVKLIIDAKGRVIEARIRESTLGNAAVERCLVTKIKTWRFPAPTGGGTVEVTYPFIFGAS